MNISSLYEVFFTIFTWQLYQLNIVVKYGNPNTEKRIQRRNKKGRVS